MFVDRFFIVIAILSLVLVASGCATFNRAQSPIEDEPIILSQPQATPQDVFNAFVEAWRAQNYEAMYALISARSQQLYPFQVFQNRYTVAHTAMDFNGVDVTLKRVDLQGSSAAVAYDAIIRSNTFGDIQDLDRLMRLVQEDGLWRVAWSTMDILNGLSSDSRIRVETRFPPRANIYDRNGAVLVEENGTIITLFAIQQDMRNVDECLDLLARLMIRSRASLARLFANYVPETFFHVGEMDSETYLANRAELEARCAMVETNSPFSKVSTYTNRRYFGHGAATHVTGWVGRIPADQLNFWLAQGYAESDIVGLQGIERAYEEVLAGKPQRFLRLVEPGGATLRELNSAEGSDPKAISLTIDRNLQLATAQAVNDAFNYAVANWAGIATGAAVVIVDVNSGEILTMFSYPTFDPGVFQPDTTYDALSIITNLNNDPRRPYINKAASEQYAPGSTYKIVTTIAAAAEGIWRPDDIFTCELEWAGQEKYGDVLPIRYDWRYTDGLEATGDVNLAQALASSCDPFYYEMGARLFRANPNIIVRYSQLFGLGQRTGFGLIEPEAAGNLAPPQTVGDAINNAIGQGNVSATALQMAILTGAVANGGTVYKPYILKQIGGLDGMPLEQENKPQIVNELNIAPEVLDAVREGMCLVTTDRQFGTATRVFGNQPYSVCGKTGTAQAGFAPHAWFVAYAPSDEPQIAIAVVVPNSREGSEVAAPIVRRILDYYFSAPIEPYPEWWEEEYEPLQAPQGGVAGG